jgi:ADP-ribose pyrophosphatase YjhB (NUDIX family)
MRGQHLVSDMPITRDITVAVFIVSQGCVLLHYHPKLAMWLPPGGHIEPHELPDEAAAREALEETGVAIELVGERGLPVARPRQLILPQSIQLEDISSGHQHIDLVYFAQPLLPLAPIASELFQQDRAGWYSEEMIEALGLTEEIRLWCRKALDYFANEKGQGTAGMQDS